MSAAAVDAPTRWEALLSNLASSATRLGSENDDGDNALSNTGKAAIACLVLYTVVCIPLSAWIHRCRTPIQGR
jgi:hypothetical protein